MRESTDAIVTHQLTKRFGPKLAVDRLDLSIPAGSLCGVIGPNGAGKTTTIRMIMSIIFPDSGELSVLGKRSAVESKDRIGYLPEERGLYKKMKVSAFLAYMARLKGVDGSAVAKKVAGWLERMELGEASRKKCEELSKGMQQKVQFIAAVIHEPDLLILDEVFSGLDPVNRRMMRGLIHEQHAAGRTILFSTHGMHEAEQLCERILMIHRGQKVLDATLSQIRAKFDPRTILFEPLDGADAAGEAAMLDHLAAIEGVDRVERDGQLGAASPGAGGGRGGTGGTLEIHMARGVEPASVMPRIAAAAPARRIELKRVSLEDVFIDLVTATGDDTVSRDDLRDAASAPASQASHSGVETVDA